MPSSDASLTYPRNVLGRGLLRFLGRLVLPVIFRIRITGRENFPPQGPLIVVGNHEAIMEVALMAVFTPWQVEVMGAGDLPHDRLTSFFARIYNFIPVRRGSVDRAALRAGLESLRQGGILGIFPEGGLWQKVERRAQTGVSWLSHRAQAPVLPIGYGTTLGTLQAALRLKRPLLTMHVGLAIPPLGVPEEAHRKEVYEDFADQVMEKVHSLVPPEERSKRPKIASESYELEVELVAPDGHTEPPPEELGVPHGAALAELLHSAVLLKTFRENLRLATAPLEALDQVQPAPAIAAATDGILGYLEEENPYFLSYRYGPRLAEAMHLGLEEVRRLAKWAAGKGYQLRLTPVRRFRLEGSPEERVQTRQGEFREWM